MIATNPHRKATHRSGKWLVVALFVLAGVIVLGFYSATYKFDPAPTEAVWGKLSRPVRVLTVDLSASSSIKPEIAAQADVIFVRGVKGRDVDSLAASLGMSQSPRPAVYYPGQNLDPEELTGNAILSRFPLYEGRSVPNKGGSFGVWAVAAIDGHKFVVASVALSSNAAKESATLEKAWHELGDPPMIGGGDWADTSVPKVKFWGWTPLPATQPVKEQMIESGNVELP